jgi:DNA-binding transcriptional MerR regulator
MSTLGIGEFARRSRLSPKALRLYAELGLLMPARVDPGTGYRWYADTQLEQARLVALLRRIGVPLARIKHILALPSDAAAAELSAYWTEVEGEHAARRELVGHLVDRLPEGKTAVYEVEVRDMPARSLLSQVRRVQEDELIETGRELFIRRLHAGGVRRPDGIAGAPFLIYHAEVSADSDGPVEWCWPVVDDQAAEAAARFPDLTLRTEAAHREVFVREETRGLWQTGTQAELAIQRLAAWTARQQRQPAGNLRLVLVFHRPNRPPGPDNEFAIPLR